MGRLAGKIALITGAASGIGAAAARAFAAEGAQLILVDLKADPLEAVTREIAGAASGRVMDITDEQALANLVDDTMRQHGRIDVALLNAGIAGEAIPIEDYPAALFDRVMAVNVRGVWLGLKYVMKAMQRRGGSIVVTSSTAGIRATPNMSAYVASKHATVGLMRAAAVEGAPKGIRVNSVNPATIDTPMVRGLANSADGAATRLSASKGIPLGREGTPEEVARLMLYLASDESSFCTGGIYMVDGGVSAGRAL